jgi:hypothetical protein
MRFKEIFFMLPYVLAVVDTLWCNYQLYYEWPSHYFLFKMLKLYLLDII